MATSIPHREVGVLCGYNKKNPTKNHDVDSFIYKLRENGLTYKQIIEEIKNNYEIQLDESDISRRLDRIKNRIKNIK